MQRRMKL